MVYKNRAGFTLIELLVVMTISGILMAFVGPVAFEQLDASKAKTEVEKLKGILRYASLEAFTQGQAVTLQFQDQQVFKAEGDGTNIVFTYLTFSTQKLLFNRNGYSNQVRLNYTNRAKSASLDVYRVLGFQQDEFIYAP